MYPIFHSLILIKQSLCQRLMAHLLSDCSKSPKYLALAIDLCLLIIINTWFCVAGFPAAYAAYAAGRGYSGYPSFGLPYPTGNALTSLHHHPLPLLPYPLEHLGVYGGAASLHAMPLWTYERLSHIWNTRLNGFYASVSKHGHDSHRNIFAFQLTTLARNYLCHTSHTFL